MKYPRNWIVRVSVPNEGGSVTTMDTSPMFYKAAVKAFNRHRAMGRNARIIRKDKAAASSQSQLAIPMPGILH